MRFVLAIAALTMPAGLQALATQLTPSLDAIASAMGGKDRVLDVRTLVMEGTGELLYFGQTHTPFANTTITLTSFRRASDFANRRWLLEQMRESRFLSPPPPPLRVRTGLDGDVGYTQVGDGQVSRVSAAVAAERFADLIYHPVGFLQAAYDRGNEVVVEGNPQRIRLTVDGFAYAMDVDQRNSLPTRITRIVDHPMLGDVPLQIEFSEWREAGGVRVPMRIVQRQAQWTLSEYRATRVQVNPDLASLRVPDDIRSAVPPPPARPALTINVEEISAGIWLLTGPAFNGAEYHTVAIEQSDRIVLVEAPENDARTLAVIEAARGLRPGKPVTTMVNTHHHFDHAGGLRAAISQGLAIYAHEANREFYEGTVYARPHTLRPDALEQQPRPLSLTPVNGKLVLRDSLRIVELYVADSYDHSGSSLIVYLPGERTIIQADMDGPAPQTPVNQALVESVRRLGLRVERVIGIHGRPFPWPRN